MAKQELTQEEKLAQQAAKTVPYYTNGEFAGYVTPEDAEKWQGSDLAGDLGITYYTPGSGESYYGGDLRLGPGDDGMRTPSPGTYIDPAYADLIDYSGARGGQAWEEGMDPITGTKDGEVVLFNPITGGFDTVQQDPNDPFKYNPRGDLTNWAFLPNGQTVLMRTDLEGWEDTGGRMYDGGYEGDWVWGAKSGMFGDGGGTYTPPPTTTQPPPTTTQPPPTTTQPPPTNELLPTYPNTPTNDWPVYDPIGYENVPPPEGDGSFRPVTPEDPVPVDTSWNWDYFREKAPGDRQWGGYDQDYQAFERYQPGMESPWGMPNIVGGNEDFYQQQFVNQLRDEQGFRNRQRAAQLRAAEAAEEPMWNPLIDDPGGMWDWAYGGEGLPEVRMGTGSPQPGMTYFDEQYAGQTPQDLWNQFQNLEVFNYGGSSKTPREILNNAFSGRRGEYLNSLDLSRFGSADQAMAALDPKIFNDMNRPNEARRAFSNLLNQAYIQEGAGPWAPSGYASPIQWGNYYPGAATGGE